MTIEDGNKPRRCLDRPTDRAKIRRIMGHVPCGRKRAQVANRLW